MNNMGLKSAFKHCKGLSFGCKIKEIYWQIRYAWQRAWRGYDDTDVFELGYNFTKRMSVLLREFKKSNIGLFPDLDSGKVDKWLTKEETNEILDKMIYYFDNCDKDFVYERLFGVSIYNDDEYNIEKYKKAYREAEHCYNNVMELFSIWTHHLWH